ncbi:MULTISPECIES: hypothetical protein [Streptomyces]|nr:hypothetical protein [Streptomyces murinus]MBA9050824.1 hypothetical protein [Streptomyces murinus]
MDEELETARALGEAANVINDPGTPEDVRELAAGLMDGIADAAKEQRGN